MALTDKLEDLPFFEDEAIQGNKDNKSKNGEKRSDAFVSYSFGTTYTTVVRSTILMCDSQPMTIKEAENVVTTWCARRKDDAQFEKHVAENEQKLMKELDSAQTTTDYLTYESEETLEAFAKRKANYKVMRLFLSSLPCLPHEFDQDGHHYQIKSESDKKTNRNWIVPDADEKLQTCQWSNVEINNGLKHYYDAEYANTAFKEFVNRFAITLAGPEAEDPNPKWILFANGKAITEYKQKLVKEGTANELAPIF